MENNKITIYTDGGSRGNPGPAGVGVWILSEGGLMGNLNKKYGKYIGKRTNNDAEYEALIFALKKTKKLLGKNKTKQYELECFLDSELVVRQLNHQYRLKEERIQKYFIEIWNLMLDFKSVKFNHIPREKNKIADALVNEALDTKSQQGNLL